MIKFRAWNGYRKIMADYVSAIQNGDTQGTPSAVNVIVNGKNETWDIKNDDVELLQFTGLTDMNGKDIYIGDIVKYRNLDEKYQYLKIRWLQQDCMIDAGGYRIDIVARRCEVIGNVHANPELLEE
ncbi:YopX family protein [Lactiplantibacillus plantarum]|uniref:YopX family protein n=1 Tax=Lactiplantibacillus plantarum TaxID=1590 RepID=UPI000CDE2C51|nr:YopX family protein [Lactiplantibacillus plantarum]